MRPKDDLGPSNVLVPLLLLDGFRRARYEPSATRARPTSLPTAAPVPRGGVKTTGILGPAEQEPLPEVSGMRRSLASAKPRTQPASPSSSGGSIQQVSAGGPTSMIRRTDPRPTLSVTELPKHYQESTGVLTETARLKWLSVSVLRTTGPDAN